MSSKIPWLALGAGAYAAFMIAFFPATIAYRWFAPDDVRLAGVEGSVWSGRAALGSVGDFALHDITWELQPWALLIASLSGQVQTRLADGFLNSEIHAGFGGVSFSNLRATTSLASLSTVLPIRGTRGLASLDFAALELEGGWPVTATGELRLGELAVPPLVTTGTGGIIQLGNYRVSFTDTGGQGLAATFEDQGGPLEVAGSMRLEPDRNYLIEAVLRARPEAQPELTQGLQFMTGEPDASGMRTFSLAGSL